jgi:Flp pilus assembly protein TadD
MNHGSKLALGIIDLMFSNQNVRFQLVLVTGAIALLYSWIRVNAFAGGTVIYPSIGTSTSPSHMKEQVCDVSADYALGMEDYSETIRLHAEAVRKAPENALAHYHLGFAEGMLGNTKAELREYQRAAALGLRNWDLFLNLGLAQLENGDVDAATDSLQRAVLLGGEHWESHFNLALVYERRGLLADAEREMLASLRLNPGQPDARNELGVIYGEEGKTIQASLIWRELVREVPGYKPARTNLKLLGGQSEVALGETEAVALPPAVAVKAIKDERKLHSPIRDVQ